METPLYKLAKRITCSGVLACLALGWLPFLVKAYVEVPTKGEIIFSSRCSLIAPPGEPLATSTERHVRVSSKDSRRSNVLGIITAFSPFVIANDRRDTPFESTLVSLSAAHSLPNDRGPPTLIS
jgi:hypothetical protein